MYDIAVCSSTPVVSLWHGIKSKLGECSEVEVKIGLNLNELTNLI